jgi:hypothetical protein
MIVSSCIIIVLVIITAQNQVTITKLSTELNRTNVILSDVVNKTNISISFDKQVIDWSNTINTDLKILNNKTSHN